MQAVEFDTRRTSAFTSREWTTKPNAAGAANAESSTHDSKNANELRATLLDSMAHDLRSPLTAIRAASEILRTRSAMTKQEQNEMFAIVESESRRLDRMIGQTIKLAKVAHGIVRVDAQPQKLRKLINLVVRQARSWLRQHEVRICISDALPNVPMDSELIGRVLRHLLENAVGYSPPGSSIEISGKIEGDRLMVTVADEGSGVRKVDEPFIFEKSFRGNNQGMHMQGTGMGLAITKAILDAHRGGIEVVNSPGHGMAFTFWIPARD